MLDYTPTPDFYNDYIAHYGVKGMKWRKRKASGSIDAKNRGYKKNSLKNKGFPSAEGDRNYIYMIEQKYDPKTGYFGDPETKRYWQHGYRNAGTNKNYNSVFERGSGKDEESVKRGIAAGRQRYYENQRKKKYR